MKPMAKQLLIATFILVLAKAKGSKGPQKISMGGGYDMYVTEEGQTWYVGGGSKSQVEVDDSTGEITILEQYGDDGT